MCTPTTSIKFCTCAFDPLDHNMDKKTAAFKSTFIPGEYEKTVLYWQLMRYLGKEEKYHAIIGSISYPNTVLRGALTDDLVLQALHENNRFDFDYTPQEWDEFYIWEEYYYMELKEFKRPLVFDYLSFRYMEEWSILPSNSDSFLTPLKIIEPIHSGLVELNTGQDLPKD